MEIIPVLDIRDDMVVHGRQTERNLYPPIHKFSSIVNESGPLSVAEKIAEKKVYVADLDAIEKNGDNFKEIKKISEKFDVLLDAGISSRKDLKKVKKIVKHPVLGTETISGKLLQFCNGDEFLSLDVEEKLPSIAEKLDRYNLSGVIVLLLEKVGTESGLSPWLLDKLDSLARRELLIYVGGGISSMKDVNKLEEHGVKGILVSTALHKGKIGLDKV